MVAGSTLSLLPLGVAVVIAKAGVVEVAVKLLLDPLKLPAL
jgi:hypothetical protein